MGLSDHIVCHWGGKRLNDTLTSCNFRAPCHRSRSRLREVIYIISSKQGSFQKQYAGKFPSSSQDRIPNREIFSTIQEIKSRCKASCLDVDLALGCTPPLQSNKFSRLFQDGTLFHANCTTSDRNCLRYDFNKRKPRPFICPKTWLTKK